jgi:hypothetical protein
VAVLVKVIFSMRNIFSQYVKILNREGEHPPAAQSVTESVEQFIKEF